MLPIRRHLTWQSIVRQPGGFVESAAVAKEGAKAARDQIEKSTGKSTVSKLNAKKLGQRLLKEDG